MTAMTASPISSSASICDEISEDGGETILRLLWCRAEGLKVCLEHLHAGSFVRFLGECRSAHCLSDSRLRLAENGGYGARDRMFAVLHIAQAFQLVQR
jgi:hypothetical protein